MAADHTPMFMSLAHAIVSKMIEAQLFLCQQTPPESGPVSMAHLRPM